jgi:hypothetical protein
MDTNLQVQTVADMPEADAERAPQAAPKLAWHAPVITRIDIKRTMGAPGSAIDLANGSQPT